MDKRTIGPFELGDRLGVGGMGIVYRATYLNNGRTVAVKVLTPETSGNEQLLKRFEREMNILKKLRHPNIVQYFGGGRTAGQHFYAMELIEGGSLDDLLQKHKTLGWERVIEISKQVAKGLEHAHNAGIIHRDLKPANLFLDKQKGRIKLGDFGIARDTTATALTSAGKTVGTYAYMAPEQIAGKPPVSKKTDLYALGCVMFQMLTGRTPFEAATPAEMLFQHLQEEPPSVREFAIDCPIWLESLIDQLLAKNPDDRPYDALQVQVLLDEVGQKVAKQVSATTAAASGGPTAATSAIDRRQLNTLLGKTPKKKKKRDTTAFYEKTWFLVTAFVLLICGVTWAMWPLSPKEMYARAQPLMASTEPTDWDVARDKYVVPLLAKNPNFEHAAELQEFLERIEIARLERQLEGKIKRDAKPADEKERLYMLAYQYETFGDRVSAIAQYQAMQTLLGGQDDSVLLKLVRKRQRDLEASGATQTDTLKTVNTAMCAAESASKAGRAVEAREKWQSVVTLYKANQELARQVEYAEARLANQEVEPVDFCAAPADSSSGGDGGKDPAGAGASE